MKTVRRGNLYMLCVLANQLVMMVLFMFLRPMAADMDMSAPAYMALTQFLIFVPPLGIYRIAFGQWPPLPFRRASLTNLTLVFFMCLAIQPSMLVLSALSTVFYKNSVGSFMMNLSDAPVSHALFAVAVMPAVFEELTMRGVVLGNYEGLPIKKAALANGVLFGLMHLNPQQFLYAMLLGIVFSYFTYYTGTLWAPMLGHFTINATQYLYAAAASRLAESLPEAQAITELDPQTLLATGVFLAVMNAIFLPVFVLLFRAFVDYNKRRRFLDDMKDDAAEAPAEQTGARVFDWAFAAVVVFYFVYVGAFMG